MREMPSRPAATRNAHPPNSGRWATGIGALLAFVVMASGPVAADESEVRKTWDAAEVAVYDGNTLGAFGLGLGFE